MKDEKDLRSRTKAFALRIIALYETLPRSGSAQVLGHQVLRSGTSAGANYRDSCRARSTAEFVFKIGVSLKELDETSYWLELADSGAVSAKKLALLLDETSQLTAILTSIAKKVRARR